MDSPDQKLRIKKLETEMQKAKQAQSRLYDTIKKGMIEQDDQLKARFQQNKSQSGGR